MLDTVKINHVHHISFTQSRLTDAVSVILSELLSYEHPSNGAGYFVPCGNDSAATGQITAGSSTLLSYFNSKGLNFSRANGYHFHMK